METQKTMVRHLEKRVQQVELDAQEKVCKEVFIYVIAIRSFVLFPRVRTFSFVCFVYLFFVCLFVCLFVLLSPFQALNGHVLFLLSSSADLHFTFLLRSWENLLQCS